MYNSLCDKCFTEQAMHIIHGPGSSKPENLCCKCYVEQGNTPADWHYKCMEAYWNMVFGENKAATEESDVE